jgi:hypothetical protein
MPSLQERPDDFKKSFESGAPQSIGKANDQFNG